jgi:sugar (pentulose or hexulose) kinase
MGRFLGIDIGSSFLKAAILDADRGTIGETCRIPFPDFLPGLPPAHCEADPAAVMRAVDALLSRLPLAQIDGVVLCGQMHGFVLVDEGGRAVSNYISWLDQRVSAEVFAEISARITEEERHELGNEFRPAIALSQMYWLREHGHLPAGATPVSIADFVAGQLCGSLPVLDPTQAAAFGALRLRTLGWHEQVIAKLGLDGLRWPEVNCAGSTVGNWRGAACFSTIGDQQCALAGALLQPGELSVNAGTGSQVAMTADVLSPVTHQTRPYFDGLYLQTITHIPSGRALRALIGLLTELGDVAEDEAWQRIEQGVAATPATDMVAGITFFPGPCGDRGFLQNLHEGNLTVGHVFRAVFASMARNYAACARRIDPDATARRVVFSGGVARRLELLRQLTEAELGLPSRLSPDAEDTLYGLLVLALAFSGACHSVGAATRMLTARA